MSLLLDVGISQTSFLIGYISLDKLQKIAKISPDRSLHRDRHRQLTVILCIALTVLLDISTVRLLHVFTRLPAFLLETGPRYRSVIVSFLCISLMSFLIFLDFFSWIPFSLLSLFPLSLSLSVPLPLYLSLSLFLSLLSLFLSLSFFLCCLLSVSLKLHSWLVIFPWINCRKLPKFLQPGVCTEIATVNRQWYCL